MVKNNVLKNTTMLYLMNIAKVIFPLLTLPYLTRVLSVECYGVVSYVKTIMLYMQLIVDFGFLLSGTKAVVRAGKNKEKVGEIVGITIVAKFILSIFAIVVLIIMTSRIELLNQNPIYTILSFGVVFLSIFLLDFLFQGLERMEVITIRFVVMKVISTVLTFVFVKSDVDILMIPILDIISSFIAIILVYFEVKKMKIKIKFTGMKEIWRNIKESFVYFASDMATSAFGALNALLIGIYMDVTEVAYWNVAMQIVMAIQTLYNPITNGIYPEMVKTKSIRLVKRILSIFMPLVILGCVITYFCAPLGILIVGGKKYMDAVPVLRALIPVLLFSFPGMVLGWPTLGAIDKTLETTVTTVSTAILQILGLILLIWIGRFNLIEIALLRGLTELFMMLFRGGFCWKFRSSFGNE